MAAVPDRISELNEIASTLGPLEVEVLTSIAKRLAMGQRLYGVLSEDDPRDWWRETFEELQDACVYSTLGALKRGRK